MCLNPFAEITLEANPDDISPLVLQGWLQTGINRLSVGVQSFDENELKWMNRAHTAKDSLQSIVEIKEAGFANFSVDLIFGSPLLSDYNLTKNIGLLVQMEVPHLSCYALTVEPRTALHKMIELKKSMPVDNEKQAIQFLLTMQLLKEAGYEQYEISNYAKVGYRSKHNSSYWQGVPYFGLGPSAHSFNGKNMRRWNKSNVAFYIESLKKNEIPYEEEVLSITQQLNEYIMTALRTTEGVNTLHIKKHFGEDRAKAFTDNCDLFVKEENLSRNDLDFFVLSEKGKLFADGIAAALFFE